MDRATIRLARTGGRYPEVPEGLDEVAVDAVLIANAQDDLFLFGRFAHLGAMGLLGATPPVKLGVLSDTPVWEGRAGRACGGRRGYGLLVSANRGLKADAVTAAVHLAAAPATTPRGCRRASSNG